MASEESDDNGITIKTLVANVNNLASHAKGGAKRKTRAKSPKKSAVKMSKKSVTPMKSANETPYEGLYRKVQENRKKKEQSAAAKRPKMSKNMKADLDVMPVKKPRLAREDVGENVVQVHYTEGSRAVNLAVEAVDNNEVESLSESDSASEEDSEEDLSEEPEVETADDSQGTELDYVDEGTLEETPEKFDNPEVNDHVQKMREIDREMKQRIIELKSMMAKQGLNKSLEALEECFGGTPPKTGKKNKTLQAGNETRVTNMGNSNQNATHNGLNNSQSEATIYKNVVEKRHSSSSEEDQIFDSSDELLLNANFIADEPRPSTSQDVSGGERDRPDHLSAEQHTEMIIKQVEAAKAKIFSTNR